MSEKESSSGNKRPDLVVVIGPTASGKTRLGVSLAKRFHGEVISADSRQVYRGMDIGTGKDLDEYGSVPVHLIDIVNPGQEFNVYSFQRAFLTVYQDIRKHSLPIMVGGTGLYLESVLKGYALSEVPEDPVLREELSCLPLADLSTRLHSLNARLHNTTDLLTRDRLIRAIEIAVGGNKDETFSFPRLDSFILGIRWDRVALRARITQRLKDRLAQGLIEEVEKLIADGISPETLDFYGLEYRYVVRYLKGELNRNDMFQKLNSSIHDFAKRQETWFRRMERNGITIHWVNGEDDPEAESALLLKARLS